MSMKEESSLENCYTCGAFTYEGTTPVCMDEDRKTKAFPSMKKLNCFESYEVEKEKK